MGPRVRGDDELKNFVRFPSRICLTGKSANLCPAPFEKIF